MAENGIIEPGESKKLGFTSKLKSKLLGQEKEASQDDKKFVEDLTDIKIVGRYEIVGKLGQGSMGFVYLGRDPFIKRNVSIKISRPAADLDPKMEKKFRERFFIEAQSAGKLTHPNIVSIYDAGMYMDYYYITMEFIDGPTLEKYCHKDELLTINRVAEIMFIVCRALDYAHKHGVVHRDIKPSNIMLNKAGEVRITDFSIAQIKTENKPSKGIVGSPSYMSPEQVKEGPVDERSDIFSLGCVLYELLTGQKAFPGENYYSILFRIANANPIPMEQLRKGIPDVLTKIINKALAKKPNERYQTCADFAYELRVALRGLKEATSKTKIEDEVDYIHSVPFFEPFTKEQVKAILGTSNIIKVPKGEVIVTEGEIDDCFFIILSGQTAVQKNKQNIAILERGECFGEMSYLSGKSRVASVVSVTECILLKISATLLDRADENIQRLFLKNFALTLVARLSKKNEDMATNTI